MWGKGERTGTLHASLKERESWRERLSVCSSWCGACEGRREEERGGGRAKEPHTVALYNALILVHYTDHMQ